MDKSKMKGAQQIEKKSMWEEKEMESQDGKMIWIS